MSKSQKIICIDLGSYNSAVGVYENGENKIIPNSEGGLTTPSVVAFTKDGIKVGEPAKRQAAINPQKTIFNIKRLMGKSYDQVKDLKRPYKIVDSQGRAAVDIDGKIYSPEEISAMILQKMKKSAEDYLGQEVERAIITVPAYFNSEERKSTKLAGEIAGFKVERIIAEPTAAVLNVDKDSSKKYAVLDVGGQTTDLSIVDVGDGVYEILSTDGDIDLGGCLIDTEIVNWIAEEFKKDCGIDLRKDPMALQRITEAAEKAKIELSNNSITEINLPYVTAIDNIPKHLVLSLNKSKLEQLISKFVDRVLSISKSSLSKSGLNVSEIDAVLLVGGTTRVPKIQEEIEKMFGKKPDKSLNPDLAIVSGAVIQSSIITGDSKDILLLDVVAISLNIEVVGGLCTKIIEANTTIPTTKSQVFSTAMDNQPGVEIHILQGERTLAKDNKSLGRFILDGILPARRGEPQIEVSMDLDANGILTVKAKDKATSKEQSIRIEGSSNLSKEEIDRMKQEAELNAESDKKEKEKIDTLNQADSMIFTTEKQIADFGDKLENSDKDKILNKLEELKKSHSTKDIDKIKTDMEILTQTWNEISTKMYQKTNEAKPETNTTNDNGGDDVQDVDFTEINDK